MVILTTNALETIRQIEAQAEEIINDATKKVESIKKKVNEEGESVRRQLIDDAHKKTLEYKKKKDREIEKESQDVLSNAKSEVNALKNKAFSRIPSAIDAMISLVIGE
jgi:vacuolar-type H+-ATPase subunit H